jgi:hypothetical protein
VSQDLYRLVYYSRNRVPGDGAAGEIRAMLDASRTNNDRVGVTGALLFNAGCFGQVLEGTREAVETTFERIQRDDRHGDVSLLEFQPVPERAFANWSMAFVGAGQLDAERFGGIAAESGFDPSRMSADRLFGTLQRLALEEEHGEA